MKINELDMNDKVRLPKSYPVHAMEDWQAVATMLWRAYNGVHLWLLKGELGSGKTTLVRTIMHILDSQDVVSSPTFSLINQYSYVDARDQQRMVSHMDLYRVQNEEELLEIGVEDAINGSDHVFVEWPELLHLQNTASYITLEFSHEAAGRKIVVLS